MHRWAITFAKFNFFVIILRELNYIKTNFINMWYFFLDPLGVLQSRAANESQIPQKRSKEQLKILWKKCVFQYILLIRMERESQRQRGKFIV